MTTLSANRLPIWPGVRMPRAILAKGRSPIDGAPTVPWVRWVLADQGYVIHVTGSLDRDGPWTTGCGSSPVTGRIVEALRDQGPELRLCRECRRVYDRSVEARLVIEHYHQWPERWWDNTAGEPWLIEQAGQP